MRGYACGTRQRRQLNPVHVVSGERQQRAITAEKVFFGNLSFFADLSSFPEYSLNTLQWRKQMRMVNWSIMALAICLPCKVELSAVAQQRPSSDGEVRGSAGQGAEWSQSTSRHLYESGSECGPDQAEPVWGEGNKLLGYECKNPSANGS